jgi:serine/threonine protein kinase
VRPIARGGMAEVWQAHDETLDRDVAVKMLHSHLADDSDFIERFRREAVAVAKLSHPNVVTVYDTGVDSFVNNAGRVERRAYLVMELLRGATLRTLMSSDPENRPTLREAVKIAAEIGDGLGYAHRNGVVHRDVKPANIFVETSPGPIGARFGRVRVVDFGIAKGIGVNQNDEDLTQVGSILGTAKYVSPEQVEGQAVDARSDIYSMGVLLYEMTTGQVPFLGTNDMATALQHVRNELRPPRLLRPNLNRELNAIIVKALAKRPDQRFPDAASFVSALRSLNPAALDTADRADGYTDDAEPVVRRTAADRTPPRGVFDLDSDSAQTTGGTINVATGQSRKGDVRRAGQKAAVRGDQTTVQRNGDSTTVRKSAQSQPATDARRAPRRSTGRLLTVLLPLIGLAGGAVAGIGAANQNYSPTSKIEFIRADSWELQPDGEHENELGFLGDDDKNTFWSTSTYTSRNFYPGKPGVGVVMVLDRTRVIRELKITSKSQGWNGQVYIAETVPRDLDGWGDQRGQAVGIGEGTTTVPLSPAAGTYVLLWITDLGPKVGGVAQVKIGDLELRQSSPRD